MLLRPFFGVMWGGLAYLTRIDVALVTNLIDDMFVLSFNATFP